MRLERRQEATSRLRARGDQPGFVGLVGQQHFVLAGAFLLQANHFLVFRARTVDGVGDESPHCVPGKARV